jgi:hypothetical protein
LAQSVEELDELITLTSTDGNSSKIQQILPVGFHKLIKQFRAHFTEVLFGGVG